MKYIKKYEELSPSVYKKAGQKLKRIGHITRGHKLIDYGYEKEYGIFKMWTANDNTIIGKGSTYTFSRVDVVYGNKRNENWLIKTDVDDLISNFKDGGDLVVNLVFYFRPTGATMDDEKGSVDFLRSECDLFSFRYLLSSPGSELENDFDDWTDISLSELYEYGESLQIYLGKPINPWYYGIFFDRESAYKFKKYIMPKVIEDVKEKFFDLYSILSIDTIDYEDCIDKLSKVKINQLYKTDIKKPYSLLNDQENENITE